MGALVVVSAGNASGAVGAPANCSASVPGVIAVAGLRNVGTKVGYSSFGPEVGIAAPAGNCVNTVGACLKSIDTTTNLGTTVPGDNSYTNETNYNLGTSFSAPIVSGIAGLMRSVNGNLTPEQLVARLESSASPFPVNTLALPVCPASVIRHGRMPVSGYGRVRNRHGERPERRECGAQSDRGRLLSGLLHGEQLGHIQRQRQRRCLQPYHPDVCLGGQRRPHYRFGLQQLAGYGYGYGHPDTHSHRFAGRHRISQRSQSAPRARRAPPRRRREPTPARPRSRWVLRRRRLPRRSCLRRLGRMSHLH